MAGKQLNARLYNNIIACDRFSDSLLCCGGGLRMGRNNGFVFEMDLSPCMHKDCNTCLVTRRTCS